MVRVFSNVSSRLGGGACGLQPPVQPDTAPPHVCPLTDQAQRSQPGQLVGGQPNGV